MGRCPVEGGTIVPNIWIVISRSPYTTFIPVYYCTCIDMNLSPSNFTGLVVQGAYKNAQHSHLCM